MHCIALHYDMTIALHFMADSLILNVQVYFVGIATQKMCLQMVNLCKIFGRYPERALRCAHVSSSAIVNAIVCIGATLCARVGGR